MLKHLHIQNYALISHLDIDFENGFSVLTGETGAGKSIILGALALVLGARAESKAITDGEDKCIIEAVFSGQWTKDNGQWTTTGSVPQRLTTNDQRLTTND
jgi:DNA repair ATPase RecN